MEVQQLFEVVVPVVEMEVRLLVVGVLILLVEEEVLRQVELGYRNVMVVWELLLRWFEEKQSAMHS